MPKPGPRKTDAQRIGAKPIKVPANSRDDTSRQVALRASEKILADYVSASDSEEEGPEHAMTWLIANLAHYADHAKLNFDDVIEHARQCYRGDFDMEPRRKPRW